MFFILGLHASKDQSFSSCMWPWWSDFSSWEGNVEKLYEKQVWGGQGKKWVDINKNTN